MASGRSKLRVAVRTLLKTREPKRNTEADKRWPHPIACELDAIPPDELRGIVERAIKWHLPTHQLKVLKAAEQSEQLMLRGLVDLAVRSA